MTANAQILLSVVIPAFNEESGIAEFHRRLSSVMEELDLQWEAIYVNDGSRDGTLAVLRNLQMEDSHIGILNLSRNFGKETAMTAGIDHARGDAVVVIDADLQDPPEVIPELVAGWREGFDMVYAQRRKREGETWLRRITAFGFYRLVRGVSGFEMPSDVGDFRLMSRRHADAVLRLRERHRFMKGLFCWVGFPSKAVLYDRSPRHADTTKWNYWGLWNFALEGITSFTIVPLKIATYLGLLVAAFAVGFGGYIVIATLLFGNPVAGYPSMMAVVLFLGGTQLITLGIIGEYLGRIFNETKSRPLYIIEGFTPSELTYNGQGSVDPLSVDRMAGFPSQRAGRAPADRVNTRRSELR
jgi:glycosyltransferase involved in cell wall biosynthesis